MPGLVDVVDGGQGVLAENTVLGPLPAAATLDFAHALADASVRTPPQESPWRPVRRIAIGARRRDLSDEFLRALHRTIELAGLPMGWNSHGAAPVSDAALEQTVRFLTAYLVAGVAGPVLVPTVRGGLQLEWHRREVDIEVEVSPGGSVSWCAEDRQTGEEFEAALAGHEDAIRTWLERASD